MHQLSTSEKVSQSLSKKTFCIGAKEPVESPKAANEKTATVMCENHDLPNNV